MKRLNQVLFCLYIFLISCSSTQLNNRNTHKQVGLAKWKKEQKINATDLVKNKIPQNAASVFFYRVKDSGDLQTSANIAINDRFQSSLQAGHFSQVYTCGGINEISAEITGNKSNDLLNNRIAHSMKAGNNYYFAVQLSSENAITIHRVSETKALKAMKYMPQQSHQISRVVKQCTKEPSRIELKILFDTDRYFVKKTYYSEIERAANYMIKYPKAKAKIEGHTDNRANDDYNMNLSQQRVESVGTVLTKHFGIDPSRLTIISYGEKRPIASNSTEQGRQQNRRVIAFFSYDDK